MFKGVESLLILNNKLLWLVIFLITIIVSVLYIYETRITKDKIIQEFNENYEVFEKIREYAESTDGQLYIDNNSGRLIISNDKVKTSINDGPSKEISIDDLPINEEISYIIKKLKYVGIYERSLPDIEGTVEFLRTVGEEEQGIVYLKDSSIKYGMIMEELGDGWYYYWIGH